MANAKHSSKKDNWLTPEWLVYLIHDLFEADGGIDLDPCTEGYNPTQARQYVTSDGSCYQAIFGIDGQSVYDLEAINWPVDNAFVNPPGGRGSAAKWWHYLVELVASGSVGHGVFLAFNAESLQSTQCIGRKSKRRRVAGIGDVSSAICAPSERITFVGDGTDDRPTHSNLIAYLPGSTDVTDRFVALFSPIGSILRPY